MIKYLTLYIDPNLVEINLKVTKLNLVDRERKKMSLINQKLKKQQADYEVPPVFDYVQQTAKHAELKKTVKEWQRKGILNSEINF